MSYQTQPTPAMEGIYQGEELLFATASEPTPFADRFLIDLLPSVLDNRNTSGRIAELGAGTGRDAVHFARKGLRVVAFDSCKTARDKIRAVVQTENLEDRLEVKGDYKNTQGISPGSLLGVYGVSSLHYLDPITAYELLVHYKSLLEPKGKIGLALKTRNASWYRELLDEKGAPDATYSFNDIAQVYRHFVTHKHFHFVNNGLSSEGEMIHAFDHQHEDGSSIRRVYYTPEQLRVLASLSGFTVEKLEIVSVPNYDRLGKTEEFCYLVLENRTLFTPNKRR